MAQTAVGIVHKVALLAPSTGCSPSVEDRAIETTQTSRVGYRTSLAIVVTGCANLGIDRAIKELSVRTDGTSTVY